MSDDGPFDFEKGDRVQVRVRENGNDGRVVAKFEAECTRIRDYDKRQANVAELETDWHQWVFKFRPWDAEFEVIGDE